MRKIAIIAALLFWIIAGIVLMGKDKEKMTEEEVVNAFAQNGFSSTCTTISAFGQYGNEYLDASTKELILQKIADQIHLENYSTETNMDGDRIITCIEKNTTNADINIKIVSYEKKGEYGNTAASNYIFVTLVLKNNIQSGLTYKNAISEAYSKLNIAADVNMVIAGSYKGYLDYTGKNILTDSLMEKISARVVSSNRENDLFVVYGYTEAIDNYTVVSGEKINVNVSITYDENEDVTYVYMATPVNNLDY